MAKLRHLALVVNDLEASARFYETVFEMSRAFEEPGKAVYLSDGLMNLALLSSAIATPDDQRKMTHGTHHFGFRVDDLATVETSLAAAGATYSHDFGKPEGMNYERKWRDPEGILFDVSEKGWYGAFDETETSV
jgi:catechol 2,3-dioxygenase-like lactoylglutathione lyase family enzyme